MTTGMRINTFASDDEYHNEGCYRRAHRHGLGGDPGVPGEPAEYEGENEEDADLIARGEGLHGRISLNQRLASQADLLPIQNTRRKVVLEEPANRES